MNLAIHHRGSLATPTTGARTSTRPARRSRAADYLADICLVTLLAAPFLLFESPSTLPEAVVVSRASPAAMAQPAPAVTAGRPLAIDP
jgi:hypothetical protein